jgi:nicotinamide-nucleotide amidase
MGENKLQLEKEVDEWAEKVKPFAAEYIYGFSDEPLEVVIGKILREKKLTLSIAESCTGGYVSHLITSVPGSSDYFQGSIIPYSYEIKMKELGINPATLENYGAVSEQTIIEMANKVREKFNTSIGVATSGIAGPGGATADKSVGTIWIAFADGKQTITKKLQLAKDRVVNIKLTSTFVLDLIRKNIS